MKHFIIFLFLLIYSPLLAAYDFEFEGIYYSYSSENEVKVSGANKDLTELFIPNRVIYSGRPYRVTSIDQFAFSSNTTIEKLIIPESVTLVCYGAFLKCSRLKSIVIEDSNNPIYFEAGANPSSGNPYGQFSNYNSVTISNIETAYIGRDIVSTSLKNVVSGLFAYSPYLTKVTFGKFVSEVENYCFAQCPRLSMLIMNSDVPPFCTNMSFYKTNISIIICPGSSYDKYCNAFTKSTMDISQDPVLMPITDILFEDYQTLESYKSTLSSVNKGDLTSIAFVNGIDEEISIDILKQSINPNCIYYFSYDCNLDGNNIIVCNSDGRICCEKIIIDEKYPLNFPSEINADNVIFEHKPIAWADGNKGWETITLPFECTNVEASEKGAIAPVMLGSSGNFWLRQYVGSSDDAVYFASTSDGVMKANTPYLIAFPGDKMGKGSLEGQTITFKAKNVTIPVTTIPSIQKNGYTFVGNYDKTADEGGGWTLNAEGSAFVWSETVGDKPFSGYFKGEAPTAEASALRMSFGQMDNTTGLEQNMAELIDCADEVVYTLDGRKIITKDLKPGLYIKNNKKMMVR